MRTSALQATCETNQFTTMHAEEKGTFAAVKAHRAPFVNKISSDKNHSPKWVDQNNEPLKRNTENVACVLQACLHHKDLQR